MTVVKVQRPLSGSVTSPDMPPVLIYDEFRKHAVNVEFDYLPTWLTELLVASPKVFAEASWRRGAWFFKKPAKWQGW